MIRTCGLIAVLIADALIDLARGGDLVECEPQRVTGDGRYWAYRIVGRECWYPGRPRKPKNELFWDRGITHSARQPQPEAETEPEPSEPPPRLAAAPPAKPQTPDPMPEEWRATADQLLAFSCCRYAAAHLQQVARSVPIVFTSVIDSVGGGFTLCLATVEAQITS
jgi:hypothetical protein